MFSPAEVIAMVSCPDCGKLVPEPNMMLHNINSCSGRARSNSSASSGVSFTDVDEAKTYGQHGSPPCGDTEDEDDSDFAGIDFGDDDEVVDDDDPMDVDETNHTSIPLADARNNRVAGREESNNNDQRPHAQRTLVYDITSPARTISTVRRLRNPNPDVVDLSNDILRDATDEVVDLSSAGTNANIGSGTRSSSLYGVATEAAVIEAASAPGNSGREGTASDRNKPSAEEWPCPQCTLFNSNTSRNCEACNYRNRDLVRTPDIVRTEQLLPDDDSDDETFLPRAATRSLPYVGGGMLLGSLVQGDSIFGRAGEDSVGGATSGTFLRDALAENADDSTRNRNGRRRGSRNRNNRNPQQSQRTQRYPRRQSAPDLSSARSSAAMGMAGYPSLAEAQEAPQQRRQSQRRHQPRASYRVVQRHSVNGSSTTIVTGGGPSATRIMNIRGRHSNPLLGLMIHDMMNQGGSGHAVRGGAQNVDGMSYEQLLNAFGDGSENLGASESEIQQLPTQVLGQHPANELPEDARQCHICLEEFEGGESRKTLPCLHGFHTSCVDKWMRSNGCCPVCKFRINGDN